MSEAELNLKLEEAYKSGYKAGYDSRYYEETYQDRLKIKSQYKITEYPVNPNLMKMVDIVKHQIKTFDTQTALKEIEARSYREKVMENKAKEIWLGFFEAVKKTGGP